ncbi:hypothetical protein C8Q72DRAFT_885269 [Fomitopsis betulina]|nr:hypothetical protein C8Q72DRAFT_885269 [Fomitopsis betulina]
MFFVSLLAAVVICAHLWVGLAVPVHDKGGHAIRVAGSKEKDWSRYEKEDWPWSLDGHDTYHFGVPEPDAVELSKGRDSEAISLQFGVAGEGALVAPPAHIVDG